MNIQSRLAIPTATLVSLLRSTAQPLPSPEAAEQFGAMFEPFGDARIVLLGEATHGTHEFYAARAAISRWLIEHHGFNIIAVEGDWPDIARIDDYVRHNASRPRRGDPFVRFPTWMWRNDEVLSFADWLRGHNHVLPNELQVSIRGLDVYSLGESIHAVIAYLDDHDPAEAEAARRRYGCLTPWQDQPQAYGQAVASRRLDSCEDAVIAQLGELLGRRMQLMADDGEDYFAAERNARIVLAAEQYYRAIYRGSAESWNLRDRHMFETLQALIAHHADARVIVWAHNSHIGDAAATAMGWQGEFNIGQLCRAAYGDQAVLIGFGTDRGSVAAATDWGGAMEIKTVLPAREDSWEACFRRTGLARSLTSWRGSKAPELRDALTQARLERAIGVVYRPQTELASHYFQAVLAEQFDAYVWFEETRAVTPIAADRPAGAPETWPFGL